MPSTIKDVAKKAGVSIATVSKFINGGNVLEENRVAIEEAVRDLNYQVNTVARGMKTRRSMTVGVLIPSLADYFGVSIDYLACGEKASVISVDGLTDEQVDLVTELARSLQQQNKTIGSPQNPPRHQNSRNWCLR